MPVPISKTLLLIAAFVTVIPLWGAEILQLGAQGKLIAISREEGHAWRVKDSVCVYQVGQEAACGKVIKVISKGAIVKLMTVTKPVAKGDSVAYVTTVPKRSVASTNGGESDMTVNPGHAAYKWDLTGGLSIGTNYFYPMLTLQRRIGNHLAIGLSPFYVSSSTSTSSVSAFGALLTLDYYSKPYFHGFWIQGGGGAIMYNLTSSLGSSSSTNAAALLTVGYRGQFDFGLNVGVGGGILYITSVPTSVLNVAFQGLLPLFIVDFGINF
jgi:hypothetical protein